VGIWPHSPNDPLRTDSKYLPCCEEMRIGHAPIIRTWPVSPLDFPLGFNTDRLVISWGSDPNNWDESSSNQAIGLFPPPWIERDAWEATASGGILLGKEDNRAWHRLGSYIWIDGSGDEDFFGSPGGLTMVAKNYVSKQYFLSYHIGYIVDYVGTAFLPNGGGPFERYTIAGCGDSFMYDYDICSFNLQKFRDPEDLTDQTSINTWFNGTQNVLTQCLPPEYLVECEHTVTGQDIECVKCENTTTTTTTTTTPEPTTPTPTTPTPTTPEPTTPTPTTPEPTTPTPTTPEPTTPTPTTPEPTTPTPTTSGPFTTPPPEDPVTTISPTTNGPSTTIGPTTTTTTTTGPTTTTTTRMPPEWYCTNC
jgi:hypothetical protein